MKDISLKPLNMLSTEYEKATEQLAQSFDSEWDDPVHDSYYGFIKAVKQLNISIQDVNRNAENTKNEMMAVRTDELIHKTNRLCSEAESI